MMEDLHLHAVDEHHVWINGRQFISLNAVNHMTAANKEEIEWLKKCVNDLPKADVVSGRDFRDCRNELCLKCGAYTERHNGACDGCRWRDV